jgi:hypothetical protein
MSIRIACGLVGGLGHSLTIEMAVLLRWTVIRFWHALLRVEYVSRTVQRLIGCAVHGFQGLHVYPPLIPCTI